MAGALAGVGKSSMSTTFTIALPSSTLRTFSASHACCLDPDAPGEDIDGCVEPENASQNADPNFWNSVCDAIAAMSACCGFGTSRGAVAPSFGDGGGDGYAREEEEGVCLPESTAERFVWLESGVPDGLTAEK